MNKTHLAFLVVLVATGMIQGNEGKAVSSQPGKDLQDSKEEQSAAEKQKLEDIEDGAKIDKELEQKMEEDEIFNLNKESNTFMNNFEGKLLDELPTASKDMGVLKDLVMKKVKLDNEENTKKDAEKTMKETKRDAVRKFVKEMDDVINDKEETKNTKKDAEKTMKEIKRDAVKLFVKEMNAIVNDKKETKLSLAAFDFAKDKDAAKDIDNDGETIVEDLKQPTVGDDKDAAKPEIENIDNHIEPVAEENDLPGSVMDERLDEPMDEPMDDNESKKSNRKLLKRKLLDELQTASKDMRVLKDLVMEKVE